jgi:hypothetical protein
MSNPTRVIRVASLGTAPATECGGMAESVIKVVFSVDAEPRRFEIPVYIGRKEFDDGDVITVARSFFAALVGDLASQTTEWLRTEDEVKALRLPEK